MLFGEIKPSGENERSFPFEFKGYPPSHLFSEFSKISKLLKLKHLQQQKRRLTYNNNNNNNNQLNYNNTLNNRSEVPPLGYGTKQNH